MAVGYIGIGSNLGDRKANCEKSIALLKQKGIKVLKRSSFYETEPWGIKEQPKFINMVIEIETNLGPEELLRTLKEIEVAMGRVKNVKWGARIMDLDILLYEEMIIKTPLLEIPHPYMKDREFVLKPLFEIAPDRVHPVFKKSIKELLAELLICQN